MIKSILNFLGINKHALEAVFTPSNTATINYLSRPDLERRVDRGLRIPGTQLIIYGHSGGGKTTLIRKALNRQKRNFIKTSCISNTTLDELIVNAFDKLNPFYTSHKSHKFSTKISSSLKAKYKGIESSLNSEITTESSETLQRVLPVQLTYEKLAEFLGAANCVWIIDDFHKVSDDNKRKLAEVMKAFVDISNDYRSVKIIAIGAVNTPREVVNYSEDLKPRLSEVSVPLLSPPELKRIIQNGGQLLNVEFSESLISQTVKYSNSLGSICHTLSYNHCDLSGIDLTCRTKTEISESILSSSVEDYVKGKSDTYQQKLDRALKQRAGKFENVHLILNAIISLDKSEVTHNEVLTKIQEWKPDYPQGNCTTYLQRLTSTDLDQILRRDEVSDKFSFSDPFFEAYCKMALERVNETGESSSDEEIIKNLMKFFNEKIRTDQ